MLQLKYKEGWSDDMSKRYVAIWFKHLKTDWMVRRQPELTGVPFVLAASERGRMVVKAANQFAHEKDIVEGMVVADCRAILPSLKVYDDIPGTETKLLNALAEWCIRYSPIVSVNLPDGLMIDISGCAHLWGGELPYLKDIITKLKSFGYDVRGAMADTIGTAWAVSRYGKIKPIIPSGEQYEALMDLPPTALRIERSVIERLEKLGLVKISSFINMPRSALRRRFGQTFLQRLDQALGQELETIEPVIPLQPFQERLPSLEPIRAYTGIEIALKRLLEGLCERMSKEEKGLRKALFKCYRIDGNVQHVEIGTNKASRNPNHLFKLFEIKIHGIEPGLGIEVFVLDAMIVEDLSHAQETIWNYNSNDDDKQIGELLDRLTIKVGMNSVHRYLPDEHFWPERAMKLAQSLNQEPDTTWRDNIPRPLNLLPTPEPIEVTVAIPDYPPILFRYKGELHNVKKADGPERIEQEWWIQQGLYRDYYCVEDDTGARYWLFRLGHYENNEPKWFLHGFFA